MTTNGNGPASNFSNHYDLASRKQEASQRRANEVCADTKPQRDPSLTSQVTMEQVFQSQQHYAMAAAAAAAAAAWSSSVFMSNLYQRSMFERSLITPARAGATATAAAGQMSHVRSIHDEASVVANGVSGGRNSHPNTTSESNTLGTIRLPDGAARPSSNKQTGRRRTRRGKRKKRCRKRKPTVGEAEHATSHRPAESNVTTKLTPDDCNGEKEDCINNGLDHNQVVDQQRLRLQSENSAGDCQELTQNADLRSPMSKIGCPMIDVRGPQSNECAVKSIV